MFDMAESNDTVDEDPRDYQMWTLDELQEFLIQSVIISCVSKKDDLLLILG